MRHVADPRIGDPPFGDIGESAHLAAARQMLAEDLNDPPVLVHGAVLDHAGLTVLGLDQQAETVGFGATQFAGRDRATRPAGRAIPWRGG